MTEEIKQDMQMTQEEIASQSNEFAQKIVAFVNSEVQAYGKPFPLAIILNSLMFIYVSTVLNSVPKEFRRGIVEDHFARVMKDLEDGQKILSDSEVKTE